MLRKIHARRFRCGEHTDAGSLAPKRRRQRIGDCAWSAAIDAQDGQRAQFLTGTVCHSNFRFTIIRSYVTSHYQTHRS